MKRNSLVKRLGVVFGVLSLGLSGWSGWAAEGSSERAAPPPPLGYSSRAEVMAAIGTGKVPLISQDGALPDGVVEIKGIEYGKVGDRSLELDLYLPKDSKKPAPGLIFIHGGAWSGGSREIYRYYTVRFAQLGYPSATISYRLSGEAPFPAAVQDAKCAVRWVRAHGAEHGIDPDKIAVIGGSAGGHLAMMVGYSSGVAALEGNGGQAGVSSRVQGVINFYGPFDFTTEFAQKAGAVRRFLGGKTYDEAPEIYVQASPATYLAKGAPPTLILHGTIDDVVPIVQSDMLAARLKELDVPYLYERLEGWPHAMDIAQEVNDHCRFVIQQFLGKHLPLPASLTAIPASP